MTCIEIKERMSSGHRRSSFICGDGSYDESRYTRKLELAPDCPNEHNHTPAPRGYLDWHSWAGRMIKTHRQERCPGCGLWAIYFPKRPFASQPKKPKPRGRPPR